MILHRPLPCRSTRLRRRGAALFGLAAAGLLAGAALAQDMVITSADGPGEAMFISTTPLDMRGLRTPDFLRRDITLMDQFLRFEESQRPIIETLHEDYLAALEAAWKELVPAAEGDLVAGMFGGPVMLGGPMGALMGDDGPGGGGGWVGDFVDVDMEAGPGGGPVRTMIAISDGGGPGVAIRAGGEGGAVEGDGEGEARVLRYEVAVSAGEGAEGGEGGEGGGPAGEGAAVTVTGGGPGVAIEISADGEGLPPEVMEQIQQQIEAQVKELEEKLAEGGDPMEVLGGDWTPPDPEEMKRQIEALQEQAEVFRYEKERLRNEFVASVKVNLTDPQLERWPAFERKLNRVKLLPKGQLNGERTDLLQVLEQIAPEANWDQAFQANLHTYEVALDNALLNREAAHDATLKEIDAAAQSGDTERWRSVADRFRALRTAVRDTNLSYAQQMADAIALHDQAVADEFRTAAERTMFPRIHRRSHAVRVFETLAELDLDPETRAIADALTAEFEAARTRFNQRIRDITLKEEPNAYQRSIEVMNRIRNRKPGDPVRIEAPEDPIEAIYAERRASDEKFVERLRALLPAEQAEKLPATPQRGRFEFSFPPRQIERSGDQN